MHARSFHRAEVEKPAADARRPGSTPQGRPPWRPYRPGARRPWLPALAGVLTASVLLTSVVLGITADANPPLLAHAGAGPGALAPPA